MVPGEDTTSDEMEDGRSVRKNMMIRSRLPKISRNNGERVENGN